MPFIPHTEAEVQQMLAAIDVPTIESLFDEIPANLRRRGLTTVPDGLPEMDIGRLMRQRAAQDERTLCFAGAGAYEHHIPAAVWELVIRGEFYSAYTPYQAEASQGTLQLLYEYQTMMTRLTGMEVSNASLYDGASALAEAVLMAVRAHRKSESKRILTPRSVHPHYQRVVETTVKHQGIVLANLDYDRNSGCIDPTRLPTNPGDITALIIPQPNFFGALEDVDALTDWAHRHNMLVIALVNPTSLALLKPPGQWGARGADIVCGEGQPLGAPLASGGPYFGFMCCRKEFVRQMPGRIIGRTTDRDGKTGYVLTLQAREQHIRRSKATSNICTNQGLLVTAATIYMSLMGPQGLRNVAVRSHTNTLELVNKLGKVPGVKKLFSRPFFHEAVFTFELPVTEIMRALAAQGIVGGVALQSYYPELGNSLLVCATETKQTADIDFYVEHIARIAGRLQAAKCPVQPKMN
ncbi:MAG: aminomethyl-transferring glycine dehydrogenase subunit GcvPA [Gammaproteobacteria bacterium]|nr:aminomethyl-transferring glycine dehydrogenase subunit GcvPA [Gammaproteobacteria bacterium]